MTATDPADDLRGRLTDNIEALAEFLLGAPNRAGSNRRTPRWGAKGSLALELTGRKRGAWFDHEAGQGGGPLELIQHRRGGSQAEAFAWARDWLGDPAVVQRPPQRGPSRAVDEEADEQRAKRDFARQLWSEARPIGGTVAERYLSETRKIPRPAGGWPSNVFHYHDNKRALIVAATSADGAVQAVQLIRLGPDGRKADDGRPAKLSYGPQDGAHVRLPGDPTGPLLVAEGPETGLTAWVASGHETWIALGSVAKIEPPFGREIVVCADDDRRHPKPGKGGGNESHKRLSDAVSRWRLAGHNVRLAYPWTVRRGDKSDLNDVAQAEGVEAVRARLELALNPAAPKANRLPIEAARDRLADAVTGFEAVARGWPPPTGDDLATPPVHAIRGAVGLGKSTETRRSLVRLAAGWRAAGDRRTVVILTPTHKLNDEQAGRLLPEAQAAGLTVAVWRGREADDPTAPGKKMCRDFPSVKLAQEAGADPDKAVCRRKMPNGTVLACPFLETCGYQAQRQKKADIWLAAHQILFSVKPEALGTLGAVVIDESFWQAGLPNETAFPLDALKTASADVPGDPLESAHLRARRRLALDVFRDHENGPVLRARLLATGLTAKDCAEARAVEWRRKTDPDMHPGMTLEARRQAATAARSNRDVIRLAGMWKALEALLTDGGPLASGWLSIGESKDGARELVTKGRRDIPKGWHVPTLLLDANLPLELVRFYYPMVKITADIEVAAPHQHVRQIIDRAYSQSGLKPLDPEQADTAEGKRRQNRLAELRVQLLTQARRVAPGRVLVVLQKAVEAALRDLGPLPANLELAHHNGVRGRDEWGDVRLLIVVGRTQPPPGAVTDDAEALTGAHVPLLTNWYDRADAIRETTTGAELAEADRHPDPLCEAIRWQICEGELLQIIGRGRGVNRTAPNPLEVLVMTDVPLALPVAATVPSAALDPTLADRMLAEGGVTFENAADAWGAYPGMWPSLLAAKKAFQRENGERLETNPYKGLLIGECLQPLATVAYQVAGMGRKPSTAWFDLMMVPNPVEWLTERLGRLASCNVGVADPPDDEAMANVEPAVADISEPPPKNPVVSDKKRALPVEIAAVAASTEELPCPAEVVPLVLDGVPSLPPAVIYAAGILEPPPVVLLTIRGRDRAPIALLEVPGMGPFMFAATVSARGLGVPLLMNRPVMPDAWMSAPDPAFLPIQSGGGNAARMV